MKKLLALVLVLMLALGVTAMAETCANTTADEFELTGDPTAIKIGLVCIGDENEGYSYAHIKGLQDACAALGIGEDQYTIKYNVADGSAATYDACVDLAESGCNVVFTNSYNHQTFTQQAAAEFPEVQFVALTGDLAAQSGMDNLSNAFNAIYEARYVSGVAAGLKINEMIANGELSDINYDENGNVKMGYVGAFPYAEVVSGYTAFFLGARSQCPTIAMEVSYVNSWSDIIAEQAAADALIADGCVIICQHSDTTGPAKAVQAAQDAGKKVYSVGYNISMLSVAPTAALTSSTMKWDVFYTYAIKCVVNGEKIATDWCAGYAQNAVGLTEMGEAAVQSDVYAEIEAGLAAGTIKVFDTATFTVNGEPLTTAFAFDTDGDYVVDAQEAIVDGAFVESYFRSAPYFTYHIDGITELN